MNVLVICPALGLAVREGKLCVNGSVASLRGANAMHVFGGNSSDMISWGMTVVREFVGNLQFQPFWGQYASQDETGKWLHPLEAVIKSNSNNGFVTIVCVFGWNASTPTLGLVPSTQSWFTNYTTRLAALASALQTIDPIHTILEVWNEPFKWNVVTPGNIWATEMGTLADTVRSAGFTGVIAVPVSATGQDESVLLTNGLTFMIGRGDIIFDIHAYEKWILSETVAAMVARLEALVALKIPFLIGETSPMNAGVLMDPRPLLNFSDTMNFSLTAWLWKYSITDLTALLLADGTPNNIGNNMWGTSLQNFYRRNNVYAPGLLIVYFAFSFGFRFRFRSFFYTIHPSTRIIICLCVFVSMPK